MEQTNRLRAVFYLERSMTEVKRPSKEHLREYLKQRQKSDNPPPTPEQVREELGWKLMPGSKDYSHDD